MGVMNLRDVQAQVFLQTIRGLAIVKRCLLEVIDFLLIDAVQSNTTH